MLEVGDRVPPATVALTPRETASIAGLAAERPILLLFYLFDWSAT
jgi:peroxiredoxin